MCRRAKGNIVILQGTLLRIGRLVLILQHSEKVAFPKTGGGLPVRISEKLCTSPKKEKDWTGNGTDKKKRTEQTGETAMYQLALMFEIAPGPPDAYRVKNEFLSAIRSKSAAEGKRTLQTGYGMRNFDNFRKRILFCNTKKRAGANAPTRSIDDLCWLYPNY